MSIAVIMMQYVITVAAVAKYIFSRYSSSKMSNLDSDRK